MIVAHFGTIMSLPSECNGGDRSLRAGGVSAGSGRLLKDAAFNEALRTSDP